MEEEEAAEDDWKPKVLKGKRFEIEAVNQIDELVG